MEHEATPEVVDGVAEASRNEDLVNIRIDQRANKPQVVELPNFPIPVGTQPVGGRLELYWQNWIHVGAEQWVVNTLKNGVMISFLDKPPLTDWPTIDSTPKNHLKLIAMQDLVQKFVDKRVVEVVQDQQSPGFYSRLFLVPKKEPGVWRGILDLSTLNLFVIKESFKMETAEHVREHLKKGEWATSLDLTEAYHHVPIHRSCRKYLRFCFQGRIFQYRALPMGLTSSPRFFTRVISA